MRTGNSRGVGILLEQSRPHAKGATGDMAEKHETCIHVWRQFFGPVLKCNLCGSSPWEHPIYARTDGRSSRLKYEQDCEVVALDYVRTKESKPDPSSALAEALEKIERWFGEFPETGRFWDEPENKQPMSYAACYGSNGERDYMREVARAALAIHRKAGE